jgi:hypothetical protein
MLSNNLAIFFSAAVHKMIRGSGSGAIPDKSSSPWAKDSLGAGRAFFMIPSTRQHDVFLGSKRLRAASTRAAARSDSAIRCLGDALLLCRVLEFRLGVE